MDLNWLHKVRLRALALAVGIALCALGAISLTTIPVWPIVGVAVAFVAMGINHIAARLDQPVCLSCGADLTSQPTGEHGPICPSCGAVGTPDASTLKDVDSDVDDAGSKNA